MGSPMLSEERDVKAAKAMARFATDVRLLSSRGYI